MKLCDLPLLPFPSELTFVALLSHVYRRHSHTCVSHAASVRTYPPRLFIFKNASTISARASIQCRASEMGECVFESEKLRVDFLRLLCSRQSAEGFPVCSSSVCVEPARPVKHPFFLGNPPPFSEAMESCPKANINHLKDFLQEENYYLTTEEGEQGRLPILILSMKNSMHIKRLAVVFLHSTNKYKEWLRPLLEAYASRGYVAIAIDLRYHGERASTKSKTTYHDALISSWKRGDAMPFIFDTVWDLIKLADYLVQRKDIDRCRVGITGESLGGMHAWFAAVADPRYTVVAPVIGVQGFRWAIDNDKWQGRVDTIKPLFEEARMDLCKSVIDKEVVKKFIAQHGIGHQMTPLMVKEVSDWFDCFFLAN